MRGRNILLAAALFYGLTASAPAGLVTLSYTEMVRSYEGRLDAIFKANKLTGKERSFAEETIVTWVFVGPCHKGSNNLKQDRLNTSVQFVMSADAGTPVGSAVLQGIAALSVDNLGRTPPSDDLCRYAQEMTESFNR
jgi:hypothetical protein